MPKKFKAYSSRIPDNGGHFGPYGGSFVAETLVHALDELKAAYAHYRSDAEFIAEFKYELAHFVGRPVWEPLVKAVRPPRQAVTSSAEATTSAKMATIRRDFGEKWGKPARIV